jgi:hypothetical protein
MSEFSESYHLFTSEQSEAVKPIKSSGLRGFVLAPENGWTSFVVDEGKFEPDSRITDNNHLCLLHYVNAEDHGWSFELFEGSRSFCRFRCDWDDDVRSDTSDWRPIEILRLLGEEIAKCVAQITPQFNPKTIDELFEHETAYDFANPTWRIRGGKQRKGLKINGCIVQVFTTEPVWPDGLEPVILGGGWAGNSNFMRCKSSCTSVPGWV